MLASPGELAAAGPFAMDLNIGSLLGPDFLRFDAALPAPLRGRVILALTPTDVVSDARCFPFAAGFARARGYRVMLRARSVDLFRVLAPAVAEFDHVTLPWTGTLPGEAAALFGELAIEQIVLTGCDSADAIAWGLANGIHLFTGRAASEAALA